MSCDGPLTFPVSISAHPAISFTVLQLSHFPVTNVEFSYLQKDIFKFTFCLHYSKFNISSFVFGKFPFQSSGCFLHKSNLNSSE